MVKIKTALRGSFGTKISTGVGVVEFDMDGVADVSEETADYLKTHFPDVYYDEDAEKPTPNSRTHISPDNDESVKAFARNHNAAKTAEAAGNPAQVVESSNVEETKTPAKLVDAKGNEIAGDEEVAEEAPVEDAVETKPEDINKDGVVDEKDLSAVHKEYSAEKKEEVDEVATTKAMLEKLDVRAIHETLVSAGVQDKKTKKIRDKETLVRIATKKLTS